jgi:hypothetical protein
VATPIFSVNGGAAIPGVVANWQRVQKRRQSNGVIVYQNYALHTWSIEQMDMAAFLAFRTLQGNRLTSLATTDIDDRNNGATYTAAEVKLIICNQVGRRATAIQIEFRVDIT